MALNLNISGPQKSEYSVDDLAEVVVAGQQFQDWLDESGRRRRNDLKSEANHASLRRAVREEATRRKSARDA